MRKTLSFFLSFFLLILASCSTSIDDSSATGRSLKINVTQENASSATSSRAALSSTPYTAEVRITENGTLLDKKSKDIAEGGATFEFKGLPVDATVDVTLTIYVGQNVITTGTGSCTIEPNKDNTVDIVLDFSKNLSTATLSASEQNKINGVMRFMHSNGITISYSSLPDIALISEACSSNTPSSLTLDLTEAGSVTLQASYLQSLWDFISNSPCGNFSVKLANNCIINVDANNYQTLRVLQNDGSTKIKFAAINNSTTYGYIMTVISGSNLQNITLDYKDFGNAIYECDNNNYSNVVSVFLPEGVQIIKNYAFYYFSNLTSLSIPKSVETLYGYCFNSSTNVTIPEDAYKNWYNVQSGGNLALTEQEVISAVTVGNTRYRY